MILDDYEAVRKSIAGKADKNKTRARRATLIMAASTALIPVAIVVSGKYQSFLFGKIIPSCLAALSALTVAWVQVELV